MHPAVLVLLFILNYLILLILFLIIRTKLAPSRVLASIRTELEALILDLEREADRDVLLLEERSRQLRALLDEADKRIKLSQREDTKRMRQKDVLVQLKTSQDQGELFTQSAIPPNTEQMVSFPVHKEPAQQETKIRDASPVEVYDLPQIRRSRKQIEPELPLRDKVIALSDKGFSADLIAARLSMPLGEIELILSLHGR